jgi:hypothetical protein
LTAGTTDTTGTLDERHFDPAGAAAYIPLGISRDFRCRLAVRTVDRRGEIE